MFFAVGGARRCRLDHGDLVNAVAFSPGGTRVVTGSGESRGKGGSVRVFDAVTSGELCRLDHEGPVRAVAFSPDGTRVATASGHSVRVLDVTTEGELCYLDHDGPVNAVAFSPDGTQLATASGDHTPSTSIYTSLYSPGRTASAARRHRQTRQRVAARRRHRRRAVPSARRPRERGGVQPGRHSAGHRQRRQRGVGNTRVLDAATGAELCCTDRANQPVPWDLAFHLENHKVNAVAFNQDGARVASGIGDDHFPSGTVGMLDATTGTQL